MTDVDANWKLFTVSRGGTVSLIKGLNQREAEYARCRALGLPATEEERAAEEARLKEAHPRWTISGSNPTQEDYDRLMATHPRAHGATFVRRDGMVVSSASWAGHMRMCSDGDIVKAEVFQ